MPNGILRQANLKSLFEKAKQYGQASFKGLYNFINFIDKLHSTSGDLSAAKLIGENENVVRIMSIHKSKGLEFPVVFLCNSSKQFNMQDLNEPILMHQDLGLGVEYIDEKRKLQYGTLSKEALKIVSKEEMLSEEMRVLYVALTRAKEQLIITGTSKDAEKDIKDKQEMLTMYTQSKLGKHLLKKYKSYLDWLELVYYKHPKEGVMTIEVVPKNEVTEEKNELEEEEPRNMEDLLKELQVADENEFIKQQLNWQYENIAASKIESKTSVSKIKAKMLGSEDKVQLTTVPNFLKGEQKLTGAQKGTVVHLCMQHLVPGTDYTKESIQALVDGLLLKKRITQQEYESIDIHKIEQFTKSSIWQDMKQAKVVEQEKTFYINIKADDIYQNGIEDDILVQGIIDLYYITSNDELVLVDYKTDYVQNEQELVDKYKVQLDIYKKALEQVYQRNVDRVYIYSTHLGKEIEIPKTKGA